MDHPVTVVTALEGHRFWSETYDSDLNPLLALEQRTLLPELGVIEGKRLLDVACGTGRWMSAFLSRGASVFGIDLTEEMLRQARAKPGLEGRLAWGDATRLPVGDSCVDIALCSFLLGYVTSLHELVVELARAVRPGGRVVATDVHPAGRDRGWKSTFRKGTTIYEVTRRFYSVDDLLQVARGAGLRVVKTIEPCFGESERDIFRRAGKLEEFQTLRERPAVLIGLWERS